MYLITELAKMAGISRTTLLYYEKLGLFKGTRLDNGYRTYTKRDLQRLHMIKQLQSAGLTLKECQNCLDERLDKKILSERLAQLDDEIEKKYQARNLLLGLLGEQSQRNWHISLNQEAPDEYINWLNKQGFDEKESLRIRWLSKDMSEHAQYMNDFMAVYSTIERWGPGSSDATIQALRSIPMTPSDHVLEIGCGKGTSTILLAEQSGATITAVDNEILAINFLNNKIKGSELEACIKPICASMTELPFERHQFDAIWAEGCVYIMGMENALRQWRPFLKKDGYLMVSDLVWLIDTPDEELQQYWQSEYPDMSTISSRINLFETHGYKVVDHFSLGRDGWENYWAPLEQRVIELKMKQCDSQVLPDIEKEIAIYKKSAGINFSYQYFILQTR
jgi:DNA-binding transcriptional MerR regulator